MPIRKIALTVGIGTFILVALHPPWIARAVLTRMSFRGFPNVPPQTLIDSTSWRVPFAPVYSPPSLDLPAEDLAKYQTRLRSGDTTAANEWRRRVESIERRYNVPDTLRSVWRRDSVPGSRVASVAFTRRVVSARFNIDRLRLSIYLISVVVLTGAAIVFASRLAARDQ